MPRGPYATEPTARRALCRALKDLEDGKVEDLNRFRAVCYGFNVLLQYFKLEADTRIEAQLEHIRGLLEGRK